MENKLYKIESFIPETHVDQVVDALNKVGALTIGGNYDYCVFRTCGIGSWRPLDNANPFIGAVGEVSKVNEIKIEFTCLRQKVKSAVTAIKEAHPYEEVVINILPVYSVEMITDDFSDI